MPSDISGEAPIASPYASVRCSRSVVLMTRVSLSA